MNERIKELMNEAVRFHWDHDGQAYEAQVHPEDLEYFAELIIKECAGLAEDGFDDELDGQEICDRIKQHFGVE